MSKPIDKIEFSSIRGRCQPESKIIAVGGGKGGVGKSFVSSSLAIFLAQMGYETLLIDLDLGAANLHTWLGQGLPPVGINEFIIDPELQLKDVTTPTQWTKLKLITGASEINGLADVSEHHRTRLMSSIYRHKADFVVLDLSAGTHQTTIDFFLMASEQIAVFTPEPSSIENAYRFLKAAFYRKLRRYEYQLHLSNTIEEIFAPKVRGPKINPGQWLRKMGQENPEFATKVTGILEQLRFQIVVNQARTAQDAALGPSIQSVCHKHFGLPCSFLAALDYDNAVWQSLRQNHHLLMANRQSHLYAQLMGIARRLSKAQTLRAAS